MHFQVFIVFLSAFLASLVITPLSIFLSKKLGLVDDKRKRFHPAAIHEGVIPRGGGLAIFLSILLITALFLELDQILVGVLLGAFGIVLVGLLDDRYDVPAKYRLILNFVIVGITILFGLGVPYITNPLGGIIQLDSLSFTLDIFGKQREFLVLSNIFSLLWIVALMNFVSWSSGVDGQLSGFTGISSMFLALLAFRFTAHDISSETVALFGFIISGAFFGFLPWHFYPQKIMPGYGGGALAGFLLGVLSILSWGKIGTMILVLSVPIVDAVYIMVRRVWEGKSPMKGDDRHFHHRLLKIGWGKRRVALFYWLVSFLFGMSALYFETYQKVLALGIVVVLLAIFIIITNRLQKVI